MFLLSLFFVSLLLIAVKNANSDVDIINSTYINNKITRVSQDERFLIQQWLEERKIEIPEGSGYNYLIKKYPKRPWLELSHDL